MSKGCQRLCGVSPFMPTAAIQSLLPMRRTITVSPGLNPRADATLNRRAPTGTYSSSDELPGVVLHGHAGSAGDSDERRLAAAKTTAGRSTSDRGRPAGPRADQHGAGVSHALAAQHDTARLNPDWHRHPVIPGPEEHGAAESAPVERERRHLVDRRLHGRRVVARNRPDGFLHRHGWNRHAAAAVSRVRRVEDGVAVFIGDVDEFAIETRMDPRHRRRQILTRRRAARHQRRRDGQLQDAPARDVAHTWSDTLFSGQRVRDPAHRPHRRGRRRSRRSRDRRRCSPRPRAGTACRSSRRSPASPGSCRRISTTTAALPCRCPRRGCDCPSPRRTRGRMPSR